MSILRKFKNLFMPIDLTKGKIFKTLFIFMVPIFLSLIFQQIYSISDAIIVGQTLNASEVSGINNAYSITFLITEFAIGLASGFSVVVAKKIGAKLREDARKSIAVQLIAGLVIGVVFAGVFILLTPLMLNLVNVTKADDATKYDSAYLYIVIISIGSLCTLFYNIATGILRGLGDSFMPFIILVSSTILNIVLDILFIAVFKWGVFGAAFATILSQFLSAIASFLYLFLRYKEFKLHKEDFKFTGKYLLEHLKLGLPLAFQFSILGIGIIVMQAGIVSFDLNPIISSYPAENGIGAAYKLCNFLMCPLNAVGIALLSYIGQNYGSKNKERIRKGFNASLIIGSVFFVADLIIGFLFTINGAYLYMFLSADKITPQAIMYGNDYIYLCLPFYITLALLFNMRNAVQGLEKPLTPFLAGIGELVARCLVCYFLPILINGGAINSLASEASYFGLCLGDPIAWILADLVLIYPTIKYIYKGKIEFKKDA